MKIESSVITYIGLVRDNNEDNYYINGKYKKDNKVAIEGYYDTAHREAYLYAVCDGMGGERAGEMASLIAVETLAQYQSTDIRRTITGYIQNANKLICDEIERNNGVRSGTTLALLYIRDNKATAYNIGDSRIYFFRDGDLYLMSEDHTEAQRLVRMGVISQEEAATHKSRNMLTQHLGIFPDEMVIEPFLSEEVKLKKNDIILLCSDGLTDMVSDDEIADILWKRDINTTDLVKELAAATQANGSRDNVTILVVKVV